MITSNGTVKVHTFDQAAELVADLLEHKKLHNGGKL